MKTYHFNSLSAFYKEAESCQSIASKIDYHRQAQLDHPEFTGISLAEIKKSKYSYAFGVEKLRQMLDVKIEKDEKVRFYDSFDGYDIDIDRMINGLDFLLNEKKVKKMPKTVDIYINISESSRVGYENMLYKAYAALKIIDTLESRGVRTALFSCFSIRPKYANNRYGTDTYIEVAVKNYADAANLGAICTAISPWFLRHWGILFFIGHFKRLSPVIGRPLGLPKSQIPKNAVVIDYGDALSMNSANRFIQNLKIT